MRNALEISDGFIVTTDNSGGIGEKADDVVAVSDRVTAYFAARVALLEQWAAFAEPVIVLIYNFSGSASWEKYVQGVTDLFHEADLELPKISGSTEKNMELMQSAVAVTMIGKKKGVTLAENIQWFSYGTPLVGQEVMDRADEVASVKCIHEAIESGIVQRIWPVGSRGILQEVRALTNDPLAQVGSVLDVEKTAGPSTVVLVAVEAGQVGKVKEVFGEYLNELKIIGFN